MLRWVVHGRCGRWAGVGAVALGALAPGASGQPANNSCASAVTLAFPSSTNGSNVGATADVAASTCAFTATDDRDVWYSFVAPWTGTFILDTNASVGLTDTTISVWSGCPAPAGSGAEIACDDDGGDGLLSLLSVTLTAGQAVRVRVAGWNHQSGTFVLRVSGGWPPPANDACAAAMPVSTNTSYTGTNVGATGAPIASCGASDSNDVWYSLVAPITGDFQIDTLGPGTLGDTVLAVFDSCGSGNAPGVELACNDDADVGEFRSALSVHLQAGQACLIRVSGYAGVTGTFTLHLAAAIPPLVLPNDHCSGATPVTSLPFSDSGTDIAFATDDQDLASCDNGEAGAARHGVWYRFIPPSTREYWIRESSRYGTFVSILVPSNGACDGVLAEVSCSSTGSQVVTLNGGVTYFVLVGLAGLGTPPAPALIEFAIDALSPPPNDACATAQRVVFPSQTSGTTLGATGGTDGSNCPNGSSDNLDVWYSFRPPQSGRYRIDTLTTGLSLRDTTLSIWSDCPPAGSQLFCNDDFGGGLLSALNVPLNGGTDYFIRVSGWNRSFGDFRLNIAPGVVLDNETCATARSIASGRFTQNFDTAFALTETMADPGRCNSATAGGVANSIWYKFTPGSVGVVQGTVDSTDYDQVVVVFRGWCGALYEVGCFDTHPANLGSLVYVPGMTYYLCIGAAGDAPRVWGGPGMIDIFVPGETALTTGACCRGASCVQLDGASCVGLFTRYAGLGTVCNPAPDNVGPCCRADFNQSGSITVQDIFDYLSAYFISTTSTDLAGNGVTVQDLFDFLRAYFAGGCAN